MAIIRNMKKKIEAGQYDPSLAIVGWMHWVDAGAAKYCREFKLPLIKTFPINVRRAVAKKVAEHEFAALKSGEYGPLEMRAKKNGKKSAKKSTKRSTARRRVRS